LQISTDVVHSVLNSSRQHCEQSSYCELSTESTMHLFIAKSNKIKPLLMQTASNRRRN